MAAGERPARHAGCCARLADLAAAEGISETQLSLFRSGKVKGIRFRTLAKLCAVLGCTPGELLDYDMDPADPQLPEEG